MRSTLRRYRELIVAAAVGTVLATSAQAMPFDSAIARDSTTSVQAVGFVCTPVCLEHKMTNYGPICSKRGQNCHMTGQPARMMPPPARAHR